MASRDTWRCAVCGFLSTIGGADRSMHSQLMATATSTEAGEGISLLARLTRCPNSSCGALDFRVHADLVNVSRTTHGMTTNDGVKARAGIGSFQFLPASGAPLSAHVPPSVQQDYTEAYLIRGLSPKASATLSRRALQGMIRDFWQVAKGTLAAEIKAIEPQCDVALFKAMHALRSVGNIGAHPERDISTIVDIEPEEAEQLLELLRLLDAEWYVARAERTERLQRMLALSQAKADAKGLVGAASTPGTAPGLQSTSRSPTNP